MNVMIMQICKKEVLIHPAHTGGQVTTSRFVFTARKICSFLLKYKMQD